MIIKVKELEITSLFLQMEKAGTICSELVVISCIHLYSIQFNSNMFIYSKIIEYTRQSFKIRDWYRNY